MTIDLTLNHVALPTRDIAASAAFYTAFGFQAGFSKPGKGQEVALLQMTRGAVFIELIQCDREAADMPQHFGLRTDDLPAVCAVLDAKGIPADGPVARGASGVDYVFFTDPSGNLVEITAPAS